MKKWLLAIVFCLGAPSAYAACEPLQATPGMIGCWPQVTVMPNTDSVDIWQPGAFPASANRIHKLDLMHIAPPIGDVTPNIGNFTTLSTFGQTTFGGVRWIYAATPNDGNTPADAVLASAALQCTALHTTLVLPQGLILLNGSHASTILQNCDVTGSGAPGTAGTNQNSGTTLLLTSTSVSPFVGKLGWSLRNMNAYWPGQTSGSTFYPPFLTDDGATPVAHAYVNNLNLINAYDGFAQGAATWGDIKFSDSTMYAVNDLFRFNYTGDSFVLTGMRLTPGPWETYCNFVCLPAVSVAANRNTILHAENAGGPGGVTFGMVGTDTFAWRYGIKTETGALVTESKFYVGWDTVGTILDTSAGGTYSFGNVMTGISAGCNLLQADGSHAGNPACFNLGSSGELDLTSFQGIGNGSFIVTAGANVRVWDSVASIGLGGGSGDYYGVFVAANSGGTVVNVQNSRFTGQNGSTHTHGIVTNGTGPVVPSGMFVRNTDFEFMNDALTIHTASGPTVVIGNSSTGTAGSASVVITGTGPVQWGLNTFDLMPPGAGTGAVVSACGSGATIVGSMSGVINVGSTVTTTSCTLTLPWQPIGTTGGACQFRTAGGLPLSTGPSGTPPVYVISSYAEDIHGSQIFYDCPGQQ